MEDEIITPEDVLSETQDIPASDDTGTDNGDIVSFRDVLNEALGKNFQTDEAALKAVQDTFSYIGKMGKARQALDVVKQKFNVDEEAALTFMETFNPDAAQIEQQKAADIDMSGFVTKDEVEHDKFYAKNADLEPHEEVIEALVKTTGKSRTEVVQLDSVKGLIDKARAHETAEKSKSVLVSSPRLGQVADKMNEARTAQQSGDNSKAADIATGAVLEAFDL